MRLMWMCAPMFFAACVVTPVLVPAGGAPEGTQATVEAMGVRVSVDGAAWRGAPGDLARFVTPVRVVVDNRSGHPLRVAYEDFALEGSDGFVFKPLAPLPGLEPNSEREAPRVLLVDAHPPGPVHQARPVSPPPPRHPPVRFYVAPHYRYWWPHVWVWGGPFPRPWPVPTWRESLPTDDMIAEALPEGVVQDGGRVEGFLYFRGVTPRESRVMLRFELVDANDETPLGTVRVPLVVRSL